MGYQAVTLHLAEPQSTLPGAALGRLASQYLDAPSATSMQLAADQMVQPLVVDDTGEHVGSVVFTGLAVDHGLATGVIESVSQESCSQGVFLLSCEGSTVNFATLHRTNFATNHL